MLRQQSITVEQAKASLLQAQLNHEIALLAVQEYRDGVAEETLKGMEGNMRLRGRTYRERRIISRGPNG